MFLATLLTLSLLGPDSATVAAPAAEHRSFPPVTARDARTAVKAVHRVFAGQRQTFFCGCRFRGRGQPAKARCGPDTGLRGQQKLQWATVVTRAEFGQHRSCWANGKAQGCRKDRGFRRMELDIANWVPSVARFDRQRQPGPPSATVDRPASCRPNRTNKAEPRANSTATPVDQALRGDIARVYLYMYFVYGPRQLPLSPAQLEQFRRDHVEDPPEANERARGRRIAAIQGLDPVALVEANLLVEPEADTYTVAHMVDGQAVTEERIHLDRHPGCCRLCGEAQPCGDRCVAPAQTCTEPPGCACK